MTDARIYSPSDPLPPGKKPGQWTASGRVPGMQPAGMIWRVAEAAHGFPVPTYLREDYPTEPVGTGPDPVTPDNRNWYYSADRLTGKVKGQISASGKIPGLTKGIWYEVGQQPDGRWAYSPNEADVPGKSGPDPVAPTPPVEPTDPTPSTPTPAPAFTVLASGDERVLVGANLVAGIGRYGNLGPRRAGRGADLHRA